MDVVSPHSMVMHCGSQTTMNIANNPVFYERMKHIEVEDEAY